MPKGVYNHNRKILLSNLKKAIIINTGKKHSDLTKRKIASSVKESYNKVRGLRELRIKTFLEHTTPKKYQKMVQTRRKRGSYISTQEKKANQSIIMKELYNKFPEKHPNRRMANRKTLVSQEKLYNYLVKIYPDAVMEYKIPSTRRFADIGILSLKIDVEYDGQYWHNKEEDEKRDIEITKQGWKVIRFRKDILKKLESIDLNNKDIKLIL